MQRRRGMQMPRRWRAMWTRLHWNPRLITPHHTPPSLSQNPCLTFPPSPHLPVYTHVINEWAMEDFDYSTEINNLSSRWDHVMISYLTSRTRRARLFHVAVPTFRRCSQRSLLFEAAWLTDDVTQACHACMMSSRILCYTIFACFRKEYQSLLDSNYMTRRA